jgi:LAGLIDADG-like domain
LTPQRLHAELLETSVSGTRAYLLGALHDGTMSRAHRTVRFGQSDRRWLEVIRDLLGHLGQRSWLYREGQNRDFWVVETSDRWLDDPDPRLENPLAYARGYFDAEGGVPHGPESRFYVQYVQSDHDDLAEVREMLVSAGIECGKLHNPSRRVDPHMWRFYVLARSHRRFIEAVGSWHPRKRSLLADRLVQLAPG